MEEIKAVDLMNNQDVEYVEAESSNGSNKALIIGGIALATAGIGIAGYVLYKRHKKKQAELIAQIESEVEAAKVEIVNPTK